MSETNTVLKIARSLLDPCPFQPRKSFDSHTIGKIGLGIRNPEVGQITPLTIRSKGDRWEIIAGERRWRSTAAQPHPEHPEELMSEVPELDCLVRNISDAVALEVMLQENMQRNDLSELEESDAFAQAIAQRDENGNLIYQTVAIFAEKIGVSESTVSNRLQLQRLPKVGREAMSLGRLSFRAALVVSRTPASIIDSFLDDVLHPRKHSRFWSGGEVMTAEEAADLKASKYVRDFRGAQFDQKNPDLVPVEFNPVNGERLRGGDCGSCPWLSTNQEDAKKGRQAGTKSCLEPSCFQAKVDAHVHNALAKAEQEGHTVLTTTETAKVLNTDGSLVHSTSYVKLADKPDLGDRASGIAENKMPSWKKIVSGETTPPILVAVTPKGEVVHLVEKKLALTAAKANGQEKFFNGNAGRGTSLMEEDAQAKRAKEIAAKKLQQAVLKAAVKESLGKLGPLPNWVDDEDFWKAFFPTCLRHAGHEGRRWVVKHRGVEGQQVKDQEFTGALADAAAGLTVTELREWCFELLMAEQIAALHNPQEMTLKNAYLNPIWERQRIDLKFIESEIKKKDAPVKKGKKAENLATETTKITEKEESSEELKSESAVLVSKLGQDRHTGASAGQKETAFFVQALIVWKGRSYFPGNQIVLKSKSNQASRWIEDGKITTEDLHKATGTPRGMLAKEDGITTFTVEQLCQQILIDRSREAFKKWHSASVEKGLSKNIDSDNWADQAEEQMANPSRYHEIREIENEKGIKIGDYVSVKKSGVGYVTTMDMPTKSLLIGVSIIGSYGGFYPVSYVEKIEEKQAAILKAEIIYTGGVPMVAPGSKLPTQAEKEEAEIVAALEIVNDFPKMKAAALISKILGKLKVGYRRAETLYEKALDRRMSDPQDSPEPDQTAKNLKINRKLVEPLGVNWKQGDIATEPQEVGV